MTRHTITPAAHVVLLRDDKVLLMRRFNTGYEDGKYGLPSGHVEKGEKASEAAAREVKEELGISMKPKSLVLVHTMRRNKPDGEYIDFFFESRVWNGAIYNAEPKKCDEVIWSFERKLPDNMVPDIKRFFYYYGLGRLFSEEGFNKK